MFYRQRDPNLEFIPVSLKKIIFLCCIDSETQFQFSFRSPLKNEHIYGLYLQRDPISKFIPVKIEIHILRYFRQQDPISKFIPVHIETKALF